MKKYIYILFVMGLTGCKWMQPSSHEGVAVEIKGRTLTYEQLDAITHNALSPEDSAALAEDYICQWAMDILEYDEAGGRTDAEIESLVEDYRRTLYVHKYEQKQIARHQPEQWPDSVVNRLYEQRKNQMRLKESIVKGVLLIVPQGTPQIDELKKWLSRLNEDNIEKIEKYAYRYATGYEYFPTQWRSSNQIILRLPIETNVLENNLSSHSQIVVEDSTSIYVLQLTDKCLSNDIMPLEYARGNLEQYLINQWKINFIRKQRQQLFDAAVRRDKIKRYDK